MSEIKNTISPFSPASLTSERTLPKIPKATPLSQFFLLKPIFGILLCILFILGGWMGVSSMVKESDPDIKIAKAQIETIWAGADPETIENQVTDKLEQKLKSLKGLKKISSASFDGQSTIIVEFTANSDINESIALVRAKVDEAKADLPKEAEQPKVEQLSVQDSPILTVGLLGNIDISILSRAAEDIKEVLEKVPNVREIELSGDRKEAIQVQLILSRLMDFGISPTQVSQAISQGNLDMPWDRIESNQIGAQVRLYGRFRTIEELENLPIARLGGSEGRVVLLKEVAEVRRDLEREKTRASISWKKSNFQSAISVDIIKVPGADTLKVIDDVLVALTKAKNNPNLWPYGMEYRVINTDADTITHELLDLFESCWQGIILVALMLLMTLTWREAIVAGISIPITILGGLMVLWMTGQTLNSMVMIGMVLALGLLVDIFVLVMEGMHERMFIQGMSFNQAALSTVQTYALPAITGQLTNIFSMFPLMAISGTMGKFIRLIPITAIICLISSLFVAFFISIPLSRFLLGKLKGGSKQTYVDRLTEAISARFVRWSLQTTVRNKAIARAWMLGTIALFITALFAFTQMPATLFPDSDGRKLSINIELPPTTTLESSQKVADDLGQILQKKDYLESVVKLVGQRSNLIWENSIKPQQGSYLVGFSALFKPQEERDRLSFEYLDEIRQELGTALRRYPGASLVVNYQTKADQGDPLKIELTGTDMNELRRISGEVQLALRQISGTTDVRDDLGTLQPDVKLRPRREALNFYGISPDDLAAQGRFLMTDNEIGDFPIGGGEEDLKIRLSTAWASREGAVGGPTRQDELMMSRVFTANGTIPTSQILEQELGEAPLSITHQDSQRTVTVLSKTQGRTVGEILSQLKPKLQEMKRQWSSGYDYRFAGEAETQDETFGSTLNMFYLAVFLVFAILVLQFGSFTQPFIIMLTIPFALIGVFGGFYLAKIPFSFPAMLGTIALVGIVVNNAIIMIETMNEYRDNGMSVRQAAARGAADRLRPILASSACAMVDLMPLASSNPLWMPLCNAIIFGLTASTVIALLVVPGLYLQFTRTEAGTKD
jgi:multidrug efflux pump subunit AcrB